MYKNLSIKYYQRNKDQRKRKRKKSDNMVVNVTKISQKMKKINWLTIEKNKTLYYNFKKVF